MKGLEGSLGWRDAEREIHSSVALSSAASSHPSIDFIRPTLPVEKGATRNVDPENSMCNEEFETIF